MSLENVNVVVTGGARGIGKACVKAFANKGATVIILDIDQTSKQLLGDIDGNTYFLQCIDKVVNILDSIIYTNVALLPPTIWQQAFSICHGDSIVVGSSIYDTTGVYTDTLNASNGCDSIVYTNIYRVYRNTSSYDTITANNVILWNTMNLLISGDYSYTLTNAVGCDSIAYLNLTITNTTNIVELTNKKQLLKVIDLLGRKTKEKKNQPLFYIYDDGTVEKRIIIK